MTRATKWSLFLLCAVLALSPWGRAQIERAGGSPTGAAGGALTGTYPNPTLGNLTTAGAIPYVSASGVLNQDATALFWDVATHRLGIGTAAPIDLADIVQTGQAINWPLRVHNAGNYNATDYGVGIRLQLSSGTGGGNEEWKWAGLSAIPEATYADKTGLAFYTHNDAADHNIRERWRMDNRGHWATAVDGDVNIGILDAGTLRRPDKVYVKTAVVWGAGTEAACNATTRGQVVMVQGGAGVADTFRICSKDGADAYAWRALY